MMSQVFGLLRESVVITDADIELPGPRIIYTNPAFTKMTGYTAEEVLGKNPRFMQGPKTTRATLDRLRAQLQMGETFQGEDINYRKGGSEFHIDWYIEPLRDTAGRITHFLAVQSDITERKNAEKALAQAEADYRSIFENAVEGIFQTTPEGRYLKANPALARMYGYESPEDLLQNITRIDRQLYVQPGRREEFAARLREHGVIAGFESEIYRRDGTTIWISEHAREVRDENGRAFFYEGTVEDITRRKELEAQFLQAQRMESIGMLASGIAHDLNNVLAPILMGSDFLRAKLPDAESRELVDMLEIGAQRGANLVKQILSFARGITGEKTLVQPRHILDEIASMAKQTFPKRIAIRNSASRDLWPIMSDTTQLHQVLLNLCVNARDAIAENGMILISAENRTLREPLRVNTRRDRAGELRGGENRGQWRGYSAGGNGENLRAVFHHEAHWQRHWARPFHCHRDCEKPRRRSRGRERAGAGNGVPRLPSRRGR